MTYGHVAIVYASQEAADSMIEPRETEVAVAEIVSG